MKITAQEAIGIYSKALAAVYKETIRPTNFLRSFFKVDVFDTLLVSIEVQRGSEKIAPDIMRGADGVRYKMARSTEKIFQPAYFRLFFEHTQLDGYEKLWRASEIDSAAFGRLINNMASKYQELQDLIERRIELMCGQVLQSGIVELKSDLNIDYKRKAESMFDLLAEGIGYFSTNSDPFPAFQLAGNFLRKSGKTMDTTFTAIFGIDAWADFLNNTVVKARQNLFHMNLDAIVGPQRIGTTGADFRGTIAADTYKFQCYVYNQFYEDPDNANTLTPYVDPKEVIVIPSNPLFNLAFGQTPQLLAPGQEPQLGQFIFTDYRDEKARTHEFHIESCPLPIPTAVDQIVTMQAKA